MKKYNLSKIMKRAWELVKKANLTISQGLKKAWSEAKNMKKKFEKYAKIAIRQNGEIANEYVGTDYDCESNYLTFRLWEKGDKKRIYANDYKRRSVGYIDCNNNNLIETKYCEGSENFDTIKWFLENYEIA